MYYLPLFPQHGIKIGMKKCNPGVTFRKAIESRVREQTDELALPTKSYDKYGLKREIVFWGICLDAHDESFKDYYVHDRIKIKKAGIQEKEQEWFTNVPLDELIDVFKECQAEGNKILYTPRAEQRACVDALKAYFDAHPTGGRFLMNCKMRFGKCYTSYKFCEEAGIDRVLVLTFVPAVESSWRVDLDHIEKNYSYYTDDDLRRLEFQPVKETEPFVMFLSLQNFLGRDRNSSDTKTRLKKLQDVRWDLVILDEYHFGAWNDRTRGTFEEGEMDLEDFDAQYLSDLSTDVEKKLRIRTDRTICLSGTPFKALASREFKDAVYSYTYFDEQRRKYPKSEKENNFEVVDPAYADFPNMRIFGYNMADLFGDMPGMAKLIDKKSGKSYFSLNEFFKTRRDVNPADPDVFINEEEVRRWLEVIKGHVSEAGDSFPYTPNGDMITNCRHTLWLMPTVNSTSAMADLLKNDSYFSRYEIINLSDPKVGVGLKAYNHLMEGINRADNTNRLGSIAITVNKLTLGVTVKQWSAVFVLKDLASPEQYFQSIFRIQTPYSDGFRRKEYGYVYDFNIDRAALLLLQFATNSGENLKGDAKVKVKVAKLIVKYLPIYLNGDLSHRISEQMFYTLAEFNDTAGMPLSRMISDTKTTTCLGDDDTIAAMMADPEVKAIMDRVFAHAKFKKPTTKTPIPSPPDDFDREIASKGRNLGYKAGLDDYDMFAGIGDDATLTTQFLEYQKKRAEELCPDEYSAEKDRRKHTKYYNAFVSGYEAGMNVPVKKLTSGREDGKRFVSEVRKHFGSDIVWTKETGPAIRSFINTHLNDIGNIPKDCRNALYKRWYVDSFTKAVRNELRPKKDVPEGTMEDADNVLKHILSRLFEFLYISVYRETTFNEIFNNADPEVFLEAVGITKEEFTVLNRYNIFNEHALNNCINSFFVNESLGSKLDMTKEEVRKKYRNSFDWFGYGVEER